MKAPWRDMGLRDSEYERICELLGREPTWTELGMFAVLWSEHCAYKHSRPVLKLFPTEGPRVLLGPGENAGVVDIGEKVAVAFRIESHNHPIFVEPYQGAATGVGGIVRDILALGARPVALLDSLRFGPLSDDRSRYIFGGVVSGISGYGNCLGIPTVGGETFFHEAYRQNPLCNVMCVGLVPRDRIRRGVAAGVGNSVMLIGAPTGRDGIHGATFASEELGEDSESRRPSVQVGNPFLEKLLIEACLELTEADAVVGIQDMGAAGITSSCAETAARAGTGVEIDVERVPLRERGMTPYEIMLSESQERMLVIVKRGREDEVRRICDKWGIACAVIGRVTDDGIFRVREGDQVVAEVPARALTASAPVYEPPAEEMPEAIRAREADLSGLPRPEDYTAVLRRLLSSPNLAAKRWVWRQYDFQVRTSTVLAPGADAAVIRVPSTRKALALATDANGRYCYLRPRRGGAIAVAEAARNVVVVGAEPIAITNCLNFGNPERPGVMFQFRECVRGMAEACRALGTPVTGGNVSFYNETAGQNIFPTPTVGMLGLVEDLDHVTRPGFVSPGDWVILLGRNTEEIGASEYLKVVHALDAGEVPALDLELEVRVQRLCLEVIRAGLVRSAHDVSDGGLAVTLAECAFASPGLGCRVSLGEELPPEALFFGEAQSRIVVTASPEAAREILDLARRRGVPASLIGEVTEGELSLSAGDAVIEARVEELRELWEEGLSWALS